MSGMGFVMVMKAMEKEVICPVDIQVTQLTGDPRNTPK